MSEKKHIKVYSAICNKYDNRRKDVHVFYDKKTDKFNTGVMNAKTYKILSHNYFKSTYTIWLDGNIFLKVPPKVLVKEFLKDCDIAVFKHPYRNCIYDELEHAKGRVESKFKGIMNGQIAKYRKEGMPSNFGLAECGMIIRKNNKVTKEFNRRWWCEICSHSHRDQLSFPYVWWKMNDRIKINLIDGNVRDHKYFKYNQHGLNT